MEVYPDMMMNFGQSHSYQHPWKRKFIFLGKVNGRWIFCRYVYRRRPAWTSYLEYEYALNDFELIQKEN